MTPRLGKHPARGTHWGISADWRPRPVAGTYVKVMDGLLPDPEQRSLVPLRVQASSQWAPLLADVDYEQPFLRVHARRLAYGGQAKGRVLYLRGNRSPLAALCWSLPPDGHPLYVTAAAPSRSFAQDAQAATAICSPASARSQRRSARTGRSISSAGRSPEATETTGTASPAR